jgi:diaminohydroxyphosphoribosylaminopyrimidine deaminase/5-amino-6-(5-phosphoribosylamino)uracil reductase
MWITGPEARTDVQHWRARACVILTGIDTVLHDDPRLAPRIDTDHTPPEKWVLDSRGRLPADAAVWTSPGRTLQCTLFGSRPASDRESLLLPERHGQIDLDALMSALAQRPANEVHVEAGATLAGALLDAGLVDELLVYIAPVLLGPEARPLARIATLTDLSSAARWRLHEQLQLGADLRLRLRPSNA